MRLLYLNLLLISAAAVSITGDIFSKTWTLHKSFWFFIGALIAYNISSIIWLFFLKDLRLSIAIPWWQAMVAVPAILAGIIYFRERLSIWDILAIVFIVIGVLILNFRHA
ncbi:MAG: hypothetical protein HY220_03625 [Candidatus Sungbacteria bacterium]|uniref:EamA domain-containing protein n=1 Tax=Candidatus Sungiibacteriota bacterium TaxID=2750080 RepID=A0A9D6LUC9_9BACT|nr:hypothetical protein [Candidatus Sungbacteria bacterium]